MGLPEGRAIPNPIVKLGVVRAAPAAADIRWIDTSKYPAPTSWSSAVAWTPDGRSWSTRCRTARRRGSTSTSSTSPIAASAPQTLLRETSPFWINSEDTTTPTWLEDGSFLWLSDRSGCTHLYHYAADGTLLKQVTNGKWELRTLHGVDEKGGWIYFSGTERSPIGERRLPHQAGRQRASSGCRRPTGTHRAEFSPGVRLLHRPWSDVSTPPQVRLHRSDGREVRVLDENTVAALAQLQALEAGVPAGEDARRLRHGSDDDQAAGLRSVEALSRSTSSRTAARTARRCGTRGRLQNMYHQLLAQHGHHRVDLRQPDGERQGRSSPRGRCSSTSASSSCATSRTA